MIPVGPIILLLLALLRGVKGRKAGKPFRIDVRGTFRLLAMLGWLFGVLPLLALLVMTACEHCAAGEWLYAPLAGGGLLLALPWPTARWVLIPLGLPRLTRLFLFLPSLSLWSDRAGGGGLGATRAILRSQVPDPAAERWCLRLLNIDTPLRGGGLVAVGLLAAERGDRDQARTVLPAVALFAPSARPWIAVTAASEWLVADAAERGDWRRVIEISRTRGLRSRLSLLLGEVGTSFVSPWEAKPAVVLWALWLLAPQRIATWPQVRRALAVAPASLLPPQGNVSAVTDSDALHRALALTAAPLGTSAGDRGPHLPLLAAWKAALDAATLLPELRRRGAVLGATAGAAEQAMAELRETVASDLVALALAAELPLAALHEAGADDLAYRVRERLFTDFESALEAIHRRVGERRALPVTDEAREWRAAVALYERAVRMGGDEVRQLLFPQTHRRLSSFAVWLFNDRDQRPLGNAMLRWLLVEAEKVGDETAIALQRKNARLRV